MAPAGGAPSSNENLSLKSLTNVLDNLDAIVYVADMETYELLYVNRKMRNLFGDVTGRTCWQAVQKGQDGPCPFCTNKYLLHSDGQPAGTYVWEFQNSVTGQWFELRDSAIEWVDGRIVRLEIGTDITKRKLTEADLWEAQGAFEALLNSITESAFLCALDGDVIVANETAARRFNTTPEELTGKNVFSLMPEQTAEHRKSIGRSIAETKTPSRFIDEREGRYFDTTVYPVMSKEGNVEKFAVFSMDVTEKHTADLELRKSEEKFRVIIENSQPVIFMIDEEGTFVLSEGRMLSSLGLKPGEVVGSSVYEIYRDYPQICNGVKSALNGKLQQKLVEVIGPKGKLYFDTFYSPYKNPSGEIIGTIGMAVDLTERVEAEKKLAAADREKEILLKELHHRVKNNLSLVSSLHSLQARKIEDENLAAVFKETQGRVRAMALVHEMLYQQLDLSLVSLDDYIRSLLGSIKDIFSIGPATDTELEIGPISVSTDLLIPLGLILNELITNIYKHAFTGREDRKITITAKEKDNQLLLIVADNGPGLPADVSFENPDNLKSLGLELVNALMGQINGTIQYVNDGGAVFHLKIPL